MFPAYGQLGKAMYYKRLNYVQAKINSTKVLLIMCDLIPNIEFYCVKLMFSAPINNQLENYIQN